MPYSVIPPAAGHAQKDSLILIVEDDAAIGAFLQQLIEDETPYTSLVAADGPGALDIVEHTHPCLFLLDYRLPGMNGVELYDHLQAREDTKGLPAIMMSATLPIEELHKRGIYPLRKPMEIGNVIRMITHALATFEERHMGKSSQYR